MSLERRRAVLEAILTADDTTAPDRLRAIEALADLDRFETERRFQQEPPEPYRETDPGRIEKILMLALEHVGADLIERRAQEIPEERRLHLASKPHPHPPARPEQEQDERESAGPASENGGERENVPRAV